MKQVIIVKLKKQLFSDGIDTFLKLDKVDFIIMDKYSVKGEL